MITTATCPPTRDTGVVPDITDLTHEPAMAGVQQSPHPMFNTEISNWLVVNNG